MEGKINKLFIIFGPVMVVINKIIASCKLVVKLPEKFSCFIFIKYNPKSKSNIYVRLLKLEISAYNAHRECMQY